MWKKFLTKIFAKFSVNFNFLFQSQFLYVCTYHVKIKIEIELLVNFLTLLQNLFKKILSIFQIFFFYKNDGTKKILKFEFSPKTKLSTKPYKKNPKLDCGHLKINIFTLIVPNLTDTLKTNCSLETWSVLDEDKMSKVWTKRSFPWTICLFSWGECIWLLVTKRGWLWEKVLEVHATWAEKGGARKVWGEVYP